LATIQALSEHGWYAIEDYCGTNQPMPGHWPTRLRDGWEYCFHLSKSKRPYFNSDAVRKPIGDWAETRLAKLGKNDLSRHNSANNSGFGRDISKWTNKKQFFPRMFCSIALVGKIKATLLYFRLNCPLSLLNFCVLQAVWL